MNRQLRVKIIKYQKNLYYVVAALNKKSIRSHYIEKIGVCFFSKKKKIIVLSLKKFSYWVNKGAKVNSLVAYLFATIFMYHIVNREEKKLISKFRNKGVIFIAKEKERN